MKAQILVKQNKSQVSSFNLRKDTVKSLQNRKNMQQIMIKKYQQSLIRQNINKQFLTLFQVKSYDFRKYLNKLYNSSKYQDYCLFGLNIRSLRNDLINNKKIKIHILKALYKAINWQDVSIIIIEQFLNNFPQNQNQIEQIFIENNYIKLNKLNQTLKINIQTQQIIQQNKTNQFNVLQGRYYKKSFTKIWNQQFSYQFNSKIQQISSNQHLIAIKTDNQISIITPHWKWAKKTLTNINKVKNIAVCGYRCYYVQQNGVIKSILIQNTYIPRYGQLTIQQKIYQDHLKQNQFIITGDNLIFVLQVNLTQQSIFIRKLEGPSIKFHIQNIQFQIKDHQLVCRKAFINKGFLYLLLFIGIQKNVTHMIKYRFLIF